uniref:Uncharacterized protein n=1 Tax=Arundo donax TaxID=35708 RepID=A0A0A9DU23_ARUDO
MQRLRIKMLKVRVFGVIPFLIMSVKSFRTPDHLPKSHNLLITVLYATAPAHQFNAVFLSNKEMASETIKLWQRQFRIILKVKAVESNPSPRMTSNC